MNDVKAIRFTWSELSKHLQIEVEKILERKISCCANADDENFWCVGFPEERIPISELYKILDNLQASEYERIDSIPPVSDNPVDVSCLGMMASELLLRRHLGYCWEELHISDNYLWILGEKDGDPDEA